MPVCVFNICVIRTWKFLRFLTPLLLSITSAHSLFFWGWAFIFNVIPKGNFEWTLKKIISAHEYYAGELHTIMREYACWFSKMKKKKYVWKWIKPAKRRQLIYDLSENAHAKTTLHICDGVDSVPCQWLKRNENEIFFRDRHADDTMTEC